MTGRDLKRVAPPFGVPDDEDVVFEPEIGILAAGRIVRLQAELAARHGGPRVKVMESTRVERLDVESPRPAAIIEGKRVEARRLIVAAGAWAAGLMPALGVPLEVTRQFVAYLRPEPAAPYAIGRFPVFIRKLEAEHEAFYGLPDYAGAGLKLALHHAGRVVDPDRVDREVSEAELERLRGCMADALPGLMGAAVERVETCLYTTTADERFVVGPLPDRPNVIVASACSGHGFKFSNLVGRVVADLALDGETDLEIDAWRAPGGL
jgi:sarcosine oxidase